MVCRVIVLLIGILLSCQFHANSWQLIACFGHDPTPPLIPGEPIVVLSSAQIRSTDTLGVVCLFKAVRQGPFYIRVLPMDWDTIGPGSWSGHPEAGDSIIVHFKITLRKARFYALRRRMLVIAAFSYVPIGRMASFTPATAIVEITDFDHIKDSLEHIEPRYVPRDTLRRDTVH